MRKLIDIISFFIAIPGHMVETPRQKYLDMTGKCYPWTAGLVAGIINAAIALIVLFFRSLGLNDTICVMIYLTLFYMTRGLKLIDGFVDLAEGISYALTRSKNEQDVWKVIRSPANGSFGLLWAILLVAWQFFVLKMLLGYGKPVMFGVTAGISGFFGSLSLSFFHIGRNRYHEESDFACFGERLRKPVSIMVSAILSAGPAFLALMLFFPLLPSLKVFLAAIAISILLGFALRLLVLKTVRAFNGDVIGFVTLICEVLVLFTMALLIYM